MTNSTSEIRKSRRHTPLWQRWPLLFVGLLVAFIVFCFIRAAVVTPPSRVSMSDPADGVGIDPKLGDTVPRGITLSNEKGEAVQFADYLGDKPIVLSLVYYECPMLCGQVMDGLVRSLRALKYDIGEDFTVLTVSFDPREGPELAREAKETAVGKYSREGADDGWHFLTGNQREVRRLADAVGFQYKWDEPTNQYVHGAGVMVLDPQGKITHYFNGIEYPARNIELALIASSDGKVGTFADKAVLLCYHYDPSRAGYSLAVWNIVRILCVLTLIVFIAAFVFMSMARNARWRREFERLDRGTLTDAS